MTLQEMMQRMTFGQTTNNESHPIFKISKERADEIKRFIAAKMEKYHGVGTTKEADPGQFLFNLKHAIETVGWAEMIMNDLEVLYAIFELGVLFSSDHMYHVDSYER